AAGRVRPRAGGPGEPGGHRRVRSRGGHRAHPPLPRWRRHRHAGITGAGRDPLDSALAPRISSNSRHGRRHSTGTFEPDRKVGNRMNETGSLMSESEIVERTRGWVRENVLYMHSACKLGADNPMHGVAAIYSAWL